MEVMSMFKKLFDGIIDICKPGIDDPICQFGGSSQNSDRQSISTAADENAKGIWQKVKKVGSTISGKKS
jgi:hypothetical protein